jgi:hypothetical protein
MALLLIVSEWLCSLGSMGNKAPSTDIGSASTSSSNNERRGGINTPTQRVTSQGKAGEPLLSLLNDPLLNRTQMEHFFTSSTKEGVIIDLVQPFDASKRMIATPLIHLLQRALDPPLTPLTTSTMMDVVTLLIDRGAPVNGIDPHFGSPLGR